MKSLKYLKKNWNTGAKRNHGMAQMQASGEWMEDQTKALQLSESGMPATASVVSSQVTGGMLNNSPIMALSLLVFVEGRPPYRVDISTAVPPLFVARAIPGTHVSVRVDPGNLQSLWVDWSS